MKKTLFIILLCEVMILGLTGCNNNSTMDYINQKINIDISKCDTIADKDGHSFVQVDCSNNKEEIINQVNEWNDLPLSENLQLIMYGGEKDGITYEYELAKKEGIPRIKNGYYLFVDRHNESKDTDSDIDLFNRYSFNFTIVLYDKDTNNLYYYEFDT